MKFRIIAILILAVFMFAGCAQQRDISELTIFIAEESGYAGNNSDTESSSEESAPVPEPEKKPEEPEYAEFFKEMKVHTLELEMEQKDWNFLLYNPFAKQYRTANVIIDGERYDNTAIRTRGNSTLKSAITESGIYRPPLKLKFDKYVEDRTFKGLDELALLNVAGDNSYAREYIGYEAFRVLDLCAPYVTFFNIYINGKLHGFYVGVEIIDNSFLDRVFDSHKHSLYKADNNSTLLTNMDFSVMEQKKGSDTSKTDLKYLTQVLDEMTLGEKGNIEDILDVDSVLKNFAVNAVLHNWDDYAGYYAHNYYLYLHDGKFYFIPWDMNQICFQWQRHFTDSDGSKQDIITPVTGGASVSQRPLVNKLLSVNEYYLKYLDYCEQLNAWLKELDESNRLNDIKDMLDENVKNDPTRYYGYYDFVREFSKSYSYGLAYFIHDRSAYLTKRIEQIRTENKNPITGLELIAS